MKTQRYMAASLISAAVVFSPSKAASSPCVDPIPVPQELQSARIVIFGELHGTREAPQFVADYICSLLAASRPVALALEIHRDEQKTLDEFVASDGSAASERQLLGSRHWQSDTPDGRSSAAMLELLRFIRKARAAGFDVSVTAIDDWPADRNRDAAQANGIRRIHDANIEKQVVVLIGNYHAKRTATQDHTPTASYLKDLNVFTLNINYPKGSMWTCRAQRECGVKTVIGVPSLITRTRRIDLSTSIFAPGFDGQYHVLALTASPPANPAFEAALPLQ
jgi:Haem-binding uptake, Tiki superfamily, ChaN